MQHITGSKDGWDGREVFNPRFGPMQPVNEGKHGMVTIDDPVLGSKKEIIDEDD